MLLEKMPNAVVELRNIVVLVCVDANHQLSDKNYIKDGRGGVHEIEKHNKMLILTVLLNKLFMVYNFLRKKQFFSFCR